MPRPSVIEIGLKKIEIPIFFPSISSIKTTLSVESYLQAIKSLKNIKYMLHCALLYHEISKMKTNILHKMYRILWYNSDERD